jgi:hypothetical protein
VTGEQPSDEQRGKLDFDRSKIKAHSSLLTRALPDTRSCRKKL